MLELKVDRIAIGNMLGHGLQGVVQFVVSAQHAVVMATFSRQCGVGACNIIGGERSFRGIPGPCQPHVAVLGIGQPLAVAINMNRNGAPFRSRLS